MVERFLNGTLPLGITMLVLMCGDKATKAPTSQCRGEKNCFKKHVVMLQIDTLCRYI